MSALSSGARGSRPSAAASPATGPPGTGIGHVPSFGHDDLTGYAKSEAEIREWIRDGSPRRLRDNPVASFFLGRQAIRMPAYGERASEDEIRQVTAYIGWLRGTPLR